ADVRPRANRILACARPSETTVRAMSAAIVILIMGLFIVPPLCSREWRNCIYFCATGQVDTYAENERPAIRRQVAMRPMSGMRESVVETIAFVRSRGSAD